METKNHNITTTTTTTTTKTGESKNDRSKERDLEHHISTIAEHIISLHHLHYYTIINN